MPVPFRSGPKVSPAARVRDYARVLVRSGLLTDHEVAAEVTSAARADVGAGADSLAVNAVGDARAELADEQESWPTVTDFDLLQDAFDELATRGVVVLQAVADHWAATAELTPRDERTERVVGVAWFTSADVWHAIEHGMLEVNLWHGDSANVAPGDDLLDDVVAVLGRHGLAAHFDEGRLEVAMRWQRRR